MSQLLISWCRGAFTYSSIHPSAHCLRLQLIGCGLQMVLHVELLLVVSMCAGQQQQQHPVEHAHSAQSDAAVHWAQRKSGYSTCTVSGVQARGCGGASLNDPSSVCSAPGFAPVCICQVAHASCTQMQALPPLGGQRQIWQHLVACCVCLGGFFQGVLTCLHGHSQHCLLLRESLCHFCWQVVVAARTVAGPMGLQHRCVMLTERSPCSGEIP